MYTYNVFLHWVCVWILRFTFIEFIYWWEFVCEIFETLFSLRPFSYIFFSARDEWPSLRGLQVIVPSIVSFIDDVTFLHVLIWVDHHSFHLLFVTTITLIITFDPSHLFCPPILLLQWSISSLNFSLHHSYTSHY